MAAWRRHTHGVLPPTLREGRTSRWSGVKGGTRCRTWPGCRGESTENTLSPRDPEFVFYDQLKQVMNAYR